jgi:Putative cyclase
MPRRRRRNTSSPAPITADELLAIEGETGIAARARDVALVRTGYLSGWPDPERLAASRGAGPDISAARLLLERGLVATGSDTETYVVQPPAASPANPQRPTLPLKERLRPLNGTAPQPASSGNTTRVRLNRGGNRQVDPPCTASPTSSTAPCSAGGVLSLVMRGHRREPAQRRFGRGPRVRGRQQQRQAGVGS